MRKIMFFALVLCLVFALTACAAKDGKPSADDTGKVTDDANNNNTANSGNAGSGIDDVVDGAGNAVDDVLDGAEGAVDGVIDGAKDVTDGVANGVDDLVGGGSTAGTPAA